MTSDFNLQFSIKHARTPGPGPQWPDPLNFIPLDMAMAIRAMQLATSVFVKTSTSDWRSKSPRNTYDMKYIRNQ